MRFYYVNQPKSEKIKLRNCGELKIPGSLMVDEDCMPSSAALLQKRLSGSIDMADIGTDIDEDLSADYEEDDEPDAGAGEDCVLSVARRDHSALCRRAGLPCRETAALK